MESLTQWRTGGDWLVVNGQHVFVTARGEGPPVLVLHGFPTASYDYARLVPLLVGQYRLILFDFLGFGFSDKPRPHEYSLFEQADIAQAVCAHFGLKRVTILTHDMGDSVALELLRRDLLRSGHDRDESGRALNKSTASPQALIPRPLLPQGEGEKTGNPTQKTPLHDTEADELRVSDFSATSATYPGQGKPSSLWVGYEYDRETVPAVGRIIMLNGSVLLDHYRPLITQRLLLNPVTGPVISALQLVGRRAFGQQFGSVFAQRPPDREIVDFWALVRHNGGHRIYHRLIRYLDERLIYQHIWLDALQNHPAPLTVIWGQRDPVSVPKIADAVLERRPDAVYFPLDDTGHYPQWEAPERVAEIIRAGS